MSRFLSELELWTIGVMCYSLYRTLLLFVSYDMHVQTSVQRFYKKNISIRLCFEDVKNNVIMRKQLRRGKDPRVT
jgi:hypothetical protein